jgi:hypothetical protein
MGEPAGGLQAGARPAGRPDVIRRAITERRHLQFRYRGLLRVAVPMVLGVGVKGRWQLRAVQVGGRSASGTVADGTPKLFSVDLMTQLTLLDSTFRTPRTYEPGDRAFTRIDTELGR